MTLGVGPRLVLDGLQWAFDTTDPNTGGYSKFWKGEPIYNNFETVTDFGLWAKESASVQVIPTGTTFQGQPVYKCKAQDGSVWIAFNVTIANFRENIGTTNVIMSAWVRNPHDSTINISAYIGHDFSGTQGIPANSDWQRVYWSRPVSSMANNYCEFRPYPNAANKYLWMTMPQLEGSNSNYPRPFTTGQRTNSTSLYSWVDGSAITMGSTLTWDSGGIPKFTKSGSTNSKFQATISGSSSQTKYSRIAWVKPTSISNDTNNIFQNNIGNNSDMAISIRNNKVSFHQYTRTGSSGTTSGDFGADGNTTVSVNNTYMMGITVDRTITSSNIKVYLNGEHDGTGSRQIGNSSSDTVLIGGPSSDPYSGARQFEGYIYECLHYDRVLTDAEMRQNFQAHRRRYGI